MQETYHKLRGRFSGLQWSRAFSYRRHLDAPHPCPIQVSGHEFTHAVKPLKESNSSLPKARAQRSVARRRNSRRRTTKTQVSRETLRNYRAPTESRRFPNQHLHESNSSLTCYPKAQLFSIVANMSDHSSGFVDRLQSGPAFLLLGQKYLALESGIDPLLKEILRRYDFEREARKLIEDALLKDPTSVLPITGSDILAEFGLSPGPLIGSLLAEGKRIYQLEPCSRKILLEKLAPVLKDFQITQIAPKSTPSQET
jgi:hypothetical protein